MDNDEYNKEKCFGRSGISAGNTLLDFSYHKKKKFFYLSDNVFNTKVLIKGQ